MDENTNPRGEDIEFKPLVDEDLLGDLESGFYETWQCPKCGYKLWLKLISEKPLTEIQN
ncbi:MAG: hypothetical protein ACREAD_02985 [Nitrosopumilaceae archaeon]